MTFKFHLTVSMPSFSGLIQLCLTGLSVLSSIPAQVSGAWSCSFVVKLLQFNLCTSAYSSHLFIADVHKVMHTCNLALRRQRQEYPKLEDSLDYIHGQTTSQTKQSAQRIQRKRRIFYQQFRCSEIVLTKSRAAQFQSFLLFAPQKLHPCTPSLGNLLTFETTDTTHTIFTHLHLKRKFV